MMVSPEASKEKIHALVRTTYFKVNLVVGALFTFGINWVISYFVSKDYDYAGLLSPPRTQNPLKLGLVFDLGITVFLVAFFDTLCTSLVVRKDIRNGKFIAVEIHHSELQAVGGVWTLYRIFPLEMKGVLTRSLVFGMITAVLIMIPSFAVLEILCVVGGPCEYAMPAYIWVKASYTLLVAVILFPAIVFSTCDASAADGYLEIEEPSRLTLAGPPEDLPLDIRHTLDMSDR